MTPETAQAIHDGARRALAELRTNDQAGWVTPAIAQAASRAASALTRLALAADAEVKRLRLEQLEGKQ